MKKRKTSYDPLTKDEEDEIRKNLAENPLTTKDYIAIFISMVITLLPRVLLILGIVIFILWFFFLR